MDPRRTSISARLACGLLGLALLPGCSRESTCTTRGAVATLTGQHDHTAPIPADHIKRGVGGTYVAKGQDHDHAFLLKDADMASLRKGEAVKTLASSTNAHTHEVLVTCKAD